MAYNPKLVGWLVALVVGIALIIAGIVINSKTGPLIGTTNEADKAKLRLYESMWGALMGVGVVALLVALGLFIWYAMS